jgi:hypothetical protein
VASINVRLNDPDVTALARDAIAAILLDELTNQQTLAVNDGDPADDWRIDVYLERSNTWDQWVEQRDGSQFPFVNIHMGDLEYERQGSTVDAQRLKVDYHIDLYTFGITRDDPAGGHIPGDRTAAFEALRWQGIIRAILMSAQYTYLGSPRRSAQWCFGRWVASAQPFQPQIQNRSVIHGIATRITLETRLRVREPQWSGEPLDELSVQIKRDGDGKVLFDSEFTYP